MRGMQDEAASRMDGVAASLQRSAKIGEKIALDPYLASGLSMTSEDTVESGTKELYQAKEFAGLAGVTVRALHHYDRVGLLRPKQRSRAGYRLYTPPDFARLEQIVVLKFLGIPLKQMRRLLEPDAKLSEVLQKQREVLLARRLQLDKAIRAISNAERAIQSKKEPDWKLFQLIVKELEMQKNIEWKGKYFSAEARAKVAARRSQLTSEDLEKANRDWAQLHADIEAAAGEDPAGPKGQELAARWMKLIEEFTGGDSDILKGLQAMMADRANWPEQAKGGLRSTPEGEAFIKKAVEAAKHSMVG
jgi:MerR family transcriptional regulator, thiopeptide resistance regulator